MIVKDGAVLAETQKAMNRERSERDSPLPSYLAGTLLLRGRNRFLGTTITLGLVLVLGWPIQSSLGHVTNGFVAMAVFLIAWMWGRVPGALLGFAATLGNHFWAEAVGIDHPQLSSTLVDAVAIAATAFLIGHIGQQLERALGDRARSDLAYSELEHVARDRMLTITDQVPVGLYRTTTEGRINGGNDALMNILGFADRDSMLKTNVWDHYVRTEDRHRRVEEGEVADGSWSEIELKRADGSVIWVRDWSRAIKDSTGQILHFDGVIEDITEGRLADEMFRAAFEDSPYGMAISSVEGNMVRGNQAVADLLNRDLQDLTNIHFSKFTFEDEMDVTPPALERVLAGEVVRYEKRFRREDGSHFHALISLAPIRNTRDPQLFISHIIDISELRAAGEALENLVRSKDELIASVSHELRTPLTVVHGLAQELDDSWMSFSIPEQKEFIGLISQQSAEVAHIVEDLLVAARADIGKLPIQAESVDVRDQLKSALTAVPELTVDVVRVGEETPVAFVDPTRVRQILRNLLVNAKRYGGPNVQARLGGDREWVWVEILDDGDGIPEDSVTHVFEPYNTAHNAAGQPSSVGLGLTVSRTLAELMGGTLDYGYDDGWAFFRLRLPVAGRVHAGRLESSTGTGGAG
jgi:PAS domain S-box-containing protein